MTDIIIIGAGGLGREVAWLIEKINSKTETYNVLGFIDDDSSVQNKTINGIKVIGKCEDVKAFGECSYVCAIGNPRVKKAVIEKLKALKPDIKFATIIDPDIFISKTVLVGEGVVVSANSVLDANVNIGDFVLVLFNSTIGHESNIGEFSTVYSGVNISGRVSIGKQCELGTGMQIIQDKKIVDGCVFGAGSVVVKDITEKGTYVGVPAKKIK